MSPKEETQTRRKYLMRTVQDAMDVLNGKWKIAIISALCCFTKRRFSDILTDVVGISNRMLSKELKELEMNQIINRMLSKELKELEMNQIIKRTVLDAQPITVHYELTEHGKTLQPIIEGLAAWGVVHRKQIVVQ